MAATAWLLAKRCGINPLVLSLILDERRAFSQEQAVLLRRYFERVAFLIDASTAAPNAPQSYRKPLEAARNETGHRLPTAFTRADRDRWFNRERLPMRILLARQLGDFGRNPPIEIKQLASICSGEGELVTSKLIRIVIGKLGVAIFVGPTQFPQTEYFFRAYGRLEDAAFDWPSNSYADDLDYHACTRAVDDRFNPEIASDAPDWKKARYRERWRAESEAIIASRWQQIRKVDPKAV